jgi:nuclear pore complex protein Nup98-Nup96
MYSLDNGDIYEAYQLFISAGLYNSAHDLAVLELAPDAIIRRDLELLKELFSKFVGRPVDRWHIRGQVCMSNLKESCSEPFTCDGRRFWIMSTS